MPHVPDLTPLPEGQGGRLAVGWLDAAAPYPQGDLPADLQDRLARWCTGSTVRATRGVQPCTSCPPPADRPFGPPIEVDGVTHVLGNAEVDVDAADGTRYAAPNAVAHYVQVHRYLPPEGFVEALRSGSVRP